jgi:hypothetical protein
MKSRVALAIVFRGFTYEMLSRTFLLLFVLLVAVNGSSRLAPQSATEAKLFKRYEQGAGYNRIIEDVLTLTIDVKKEERATVAVRVCAKQSLPLALVTANADPFHIAELLTNGYAYSFSQVVFLRSEDCLGKEPSSNTVEIWTLAQGASLPAHVELLESSRAQRSSLGKSQAYRGVRDYRNAVDQLVKKLQSDPASTGVVIGFYLKRPSAGLQRRLKEVTRIFEHSGLSRERYLVRSLYWNDEVSTMPPESEPQYPAVFIIRQVD